LEVLIVAGFEVFIVLLFKVILINIVLSADNAVVIALACRNLPPEQQNKAYLFGSIGAVVLMVGLTFVALWFLRIPFLQVVGGLMLLWIAIKLLKGEEDEGNIKQHANLFDAVRTIIIADVVMSLDNTVAVAATAQGNLLLIGLGLAVSIPLIIWGANLLTKLMIRFPFIVYIGAGLLGYTSGEMILGDKIVGRMLERTFPTSSWVIPWLLAAVVLVFGKWLQMRDEVGGGRRKAS
jgi:YjbE family integral membrane protein